MVDVKLVEGDILGGSLEGLLPWLGVNLALDHLGVRDLQGLPIPVTCLRDI